MASFLLKVIEIRQETKDTVTFCFKQPGLKKIKYLPGQYLTVVVAINNRKYKRAYSFSSTFGVDSNIEITIKRVLNGRVSNHLIDTLKVGDMQEVMEPMGAFVYSENQNSADEIYLWGAGSGITPLISIIKAVLNGNTQTRLILNYCTRSIVETIFYNQLNILKSAYPDRLIINMFYTKEAVANSFHGRINDDSIIEILQQYNALERSIHFICGPLDLKNKVRLVLKDHNIESDRVFSEDFEHTINESELENVQTQYVKFKKNGEIFEAEVIRGKSILEAGLDIGLDIPYSCQTGTCKLCHAQVISGKVKTLVIDDQPEGSECDEGHLLCCSYPLNEDVVIVLE